MLIGTFRKPLATIVGLAAYLSVLIVHESGHLLMARLKGYDALSMELYPFSGFARFERPSSRFDWALIAWGGVLAQAIVGIPVFLYVVVWGYTPFEPLNAVLAVLGGFSLFVALLNLLPVGPLDGTVAWDLIPAFFEDRRIQGNRRVVPYRSSR
jgi:Zn-dependent protease